MLALEISVIKRLDADFTCKNRGHKPDCHQYDVKRPGPAEYSALRIQAAVERGLRNANPDSKYAAENDRLDAATVKSENTRDLLGSS